MGKSVDNIVYAAIALVDAGTPEERASTVTLAPQLGALIRAVEAANLAEGEQVFCLREQDLAAPPTIDSYVIHAERLHAPGEHLEACRRIAAQWREDQQSGKIKAKVPD